MPAGSLTIVGTGYRIGGHVTLEALAAMEQADKLLYLVSDPLTKLWLDERNPTAESLHDCYAEGKPREQTYAEMVERILGYVRQGLDVTVAFYGHPGVYAYPAHTAIRRARREGYRVTLQPGVSAADCLFAELGVDPADHGYQAWDATDFLSRRPRFDTSCVLVLWQIGVIGVESITRTADMEGVRELAQVLCRHYPGDHRVVIYQTSSYPVCKPIVRRVALKKLADADVPVMATLYVPPRRKRRARKRP